MNIFFSGSIRGGRDDRDLYVDLIEHLEDHGTVLTEHVGTENVEEMEAEAGSPTTRSTTKTSSGSSKPISSSPK